MELTTLLNSIITAASVLVSVGLVFIIFTYSNYQNKKSDILLQMKSLYPSFNAFRELVYHVFQTNLWQNNEIIREFKRANQEKAKELIKEYEFLSLYKCYKFISDTFSEEKINNSNKIFSYEEINKYKNCTNSIWYAINCRTDIQGQINGNWLPDIDDNRLRNIKQLIHKINPEYNNELISIDLIAEIAGEMEETIINSLSELAWLFEQPLQPKFKKLFWLFTSTLILGVAFPLVLILIPCILTFWTALFEVISIIVCLFLFIKLTASYIGIFK